VHNKIAHDNKDARQKGHGTLVQIDDATIASFIAEIARTLRPSGHLLLWTNKFHPFQGVASWLANTPLSAVNLIMWDKTRVRMVYHSHQRSEYLTILQKAPLRTKGVWHDHAIFGIWSEKPGPGHPHHRPLELQRRLIEAVTTPGDLVFDHTADGFSTPEAVEACAEPRVFLGADLPT